MNSCDHELMRQERQRQRNEGNGDKLTAKQDVKEQPTEAVAPIQDEARKQKEEVDEAARKKAEEAAVKQAKRAQLEAARKRREETEKRLHEQRARVGTPPSSPAKTNSPAAAMVDKPGQAEEIRNVATAQPPAAQPAQQPAAAQADIKEAEEAARKKAEETAKKIALLAEAKRKRAEREKQLEELRLRTGNTPPPSPVKALTSSSILERSASPQSPAQMSAAGTPAASPFGFGLLGHLQQGSAEGERAIANSAQAEPVVQKHTP